MKKPLLGAMSLFTFLTGCFGARKEAEKPPTAPFPRFPDTDVAGVTFERIALEDGFYMKTFFISTDKRHLYVLAYKDSGTRIPDDPRPPERTDARLIELDMKGVATRRIKFPRTRDAWGSSMGMVDGDLMLLTGDHFIVINTNTFSATERIPVWYDQHFPTKQNIELMTRDEYRPAYEALFDAATKECATCRWMVWPGGKLYVYVPGPAGKRAAWEPLTYEDEVIKPLEKRFPPIVVSVNPTVNDGVKGGDFTVTDGTASIVEEAILDGGTELDYPNYKHRSIVQYALTIGTRALHFSTTDQKRNDARIGFADNIYLTTADGAVWVRYMGALFRIHHGADAA